MPQCLFCLREEKGDSGHFTDEHVFPAALGGNLIVRDGSCDVCNHGNSKFEQALAVWHGKYQSETYEGAFHGWTTPDAPVYNKEQADLAFENLTALFTRTLK